MRLLVQPGDGVLPLLKGIAAAKKSIELVIFRFDQREVEHALASAVSRDVSVHALIAHTNKAGEENLRKLELRLLAEGVTVSRTADDLVRYHGKFMIIDRRELHLLAFNLTMLDIERSRSFGLIIHHRSIVAEAVKLFECDSQRRPYEPGRDDLVVSPVNARRRLAKLIKSAKKELVIYDLKISDGEMLHHLAERAKAGVNIRIIGRMTRKIPGVTVRRLHEMRLHTRTIIVDGRTAFLGSQSLRGNELDARREVGLIFKEPKIVAQLLKTFHDDWTLANQNEGQNALHDKPVARVAKKVAKVVTRDLPEVLPVLSNIVEEVVGDKKGVNPRELEETVKHAVQDAVAEALRNVVGEIAEQRGAE